VFSSTFLAAGLPNLGAVVALFGFLDLIAIFVIRWQWVARFESRQPTGPFFFLGPEFFLSAHVLFCVLCRVLVFVCIRGLTGFALSL